MDNMTVDYRDDGYWTITSREPDGMPQDEVGEFATEADAVEVLGKFKSFPEVVEHLKSSRK